MGASLMSSTDLPSGMTSKIGAYEIGFWWQSETEHRFLFSSRRWLLGQAIFAFVNQILKYYWDQGWYWYRKCEDSEFYLRWLEPNLGDRYQIFLWYLIGIHQFFSRCLNQSWRYRACSFSWKMLEIDYLEDFRELYNWIFEVIRLSD